MKKTAAVLAVLLAGPALALAQKPMTQAESIEVTGTIEAIDHTTREVTIKNPAGALDTYYVGPEAKRFAELKVGDKVTARYYAAVAFQLRKPGAPAPAAASEDVKLVPGKGPKPGGTMSQQKTGTVTVKAVDAKVPSITVLTGDGRTVSFKVEDPKKLQGVQPGDKIDMTYTEAVIVTVQ
jgi:Cu/Ag efflux protein CusF